MSYDRWKSTDPDLHAGEPFGACDCCGKHRPLSRCWTGVGVSGIETWACDECRGGDGEDDDVAVHD
jgi:hypothetical protein